MKKKTNILYYLKRIIKYAKGSKKYLIAILLLNIIYSIFSVIGPILSARQTLSLTNELWQQLAIITAVLLIVELLRNFVIYLSDILFEKSFFNLRKHLQLACASEALKIDTNTLNHNSSGLFIERINNDTGSLSDILTDSLSFITAIITKIGILISIFFLNKIIFLVYFLFVIIMFFFRYYAEKRIQEKRKIYMEKKESSLGMVGELVRGAKDIKILNAEDSFLKKTDETLVDTNIANYDLDKCRIRINFINNFFRDSLNALIIFIGIYYLVNQQLEVATALIIVSYRSQIMNISNNIAFFLEDIKNFELAAERILEIIDSNKFPKEHFGTKHLDKVEGFIEFKNVSFGYEENVPVLKEISLKIHPNETVSFVGKSGSGKSTIFNLITNLYNPDKGEILFDGIPLTSLDKDSIRGNLSLISQNPYIFNMSIRENLTIIKDDLTEEEMIEACKMACLHDFIMSLKDGYDTIVGEGGVVLSGGQKQRLAIARALVLKTEIILFDEATSALDNETQYEIQQSIANMQGEYTILIIAHRLSTVINSDRILLIDDGKIVGEGTHHDLLENNPIYQKLYKLELSDK